jgi:aryl-alcohol dehydrogenase-like predicted oxidoreductase
VQYKKLGRTGLKVSVVSLGCLEFGRKVSETAASDIISSALAAGVNFIDTADIYGKERFDIPDRGTSEEVVGRALKGLGKSSPPANGLY